VSPNCLNRISPTPNYLSVSYHHPRLGGRRVALLTFTSQADTPMNVHAVFWVCAWPPRSCVRGAASARVRVNLGAVHLMFGDQSSVSIQAASHILHSRAVRRGRVYLLTRVEIRAHRLNRWFFTTTCGTQPTSTHLALRSCCGVGRLRRVLQSPVG